MPLHYLPTPATIVLARSLGRHVCMIALRGHQPTGCIQYSAGQAGGLGEMVGGFDCDMQDFMPEASKECHAVTPRPSGRPPARPHWELDLVHNPRPRQTVAAAVARHFHAFKYTRTVSTKTLLNKRHG